MGRWRKRRQTDLVLAGGQPDVLEAPVEADHLRGHQVELVDLEHLLLLCLLVRGDGNGLAHLARLASLLGHYLSFAPGPQFTSVIFLHLPPMVVHIHLLSELDAPLLSGHVTGAAAEADAAAAVRVGEEEHDVHDTPDEGGHDDDLAGVPPTPQQGRHGGTVCQSVTGTVSTVSSSQSLRQSGSHCASLAVPGCLTVTDWQPSSLASSVCQTV